MKDYIRYSVNEIIKHNHHKTPSTRLDYYVDFLSQFYNYDDAFASLVTDNKLECTEKEFNRRMFNLFENGNGICQDFSNGLNFVLNTDKIPGHDLYLKLKDIGTTKAPEDHSINFIPRGVASNQSEIIDMTKIWGSLKNRRPGEADYKSEFNRVNLYQLKCAYERKNVRLCKFVRTFQNKFSPYFYRIDHFKNSNGGTNFDQLYDSIFRGTYNNIGDKIPQREID